MTQPNFWERMRAYMHALLLFSVDIFRIITAPIMYPIYYIFFRKWLSEKWELYSGWMEGHQRQSVRQAIIGRYGWLGYFVYLYGDMQDPLGCGGVPDDYLPDAWTFWRRYRWSAIRNPMFNLVHLSPWYNTDWITGYWVEYDTRVDDMAATTIGLGPQRLGKVKMWYQDVSFKWYFIYERADEKRYQYIGWVGLLDIFPLKKSGVRGRYEYAFRTPKEIITLD